MALSSNLFVTNLFELVFFRAFLENLPYKSTYKIAILQFLPTYPLLRFIIFYKPNVYPYIYRCPRRNGQNFGRVLLVLKYTDITQNTYIKS